MIIRRICFFVVMIVLWGSGSLSTAQETSFAASLEPVQGLIQLQIAGEDNWQTISDITLVNEGDRIRSDGHGVAYLTFFDGAEVQIGPNSLIVVSTLVEQNGGAAVTVDVLLGSALTNIDVALDASDRFEVHAPGASAVVRGTHWWTIVDRDGNTVFIALDGDVEVFPHRDDAEPFILDLNSPVWVSPDGTAQPIPGFLPPTFPTETPATCGDGVCAEGEACALDCTAPPPSCGDAICDPNEDLVLCAADCGPAPAESCGDGVCDGNESDLTCRDDCEPGRYFTPARPALCGNNTCDPTESNLTCPGDCQPIQSDACQITATNINLREGPGTNYPIVGVLNGEHLPVLGQNNGWYVVTHNNNPAWVAARLVDKTGPCDDLLWYEAPPAPSVTPETPATTSGGWEPCGSCDSCGYPASECVTSPEGQCLWNPRLCRPPDPSSGGGSFSVSPCNVSCLVSTTLVGTYSGSGTISDTNVNSAATYFVFTTTMISPTQFAVVIQCFATAQPAQAVAITMWDDSGQEYSQTCMVAVQ